jgi:hypothetical protein
MTLHGDFEPPRRASGADVSLEATLATQRAVASLLDVVEELAQGLAAGQTPERDWGEQVAQTFENHRRELRGETVNWEAT